MKQLVTSMLFIIVCLSSGNGYALEWSNFFKSSEQRAMELLDSGQPEAAAGLFEDPGWRGVSQYRAQQYREAMQTFSGSETASDLYNHGTAAARAGDYNQAIASLEAASEIEPDNKNIRRNLEIARKLEEIAKKNQQQQPSGDDQQSPPENEDQENQDQENQDQDQEQQEQQDGSSNDNSQEQQSDSRESDQSASESEQSSAETDQADQTDNTDDEKNAETNADTQQAQDAEALREQMQQQMTESDESENDGQQQVQAQEDDSVSEGDQASEQWLRRIPEDASQLLRNKIRLNHLLEYPTVNDMQEPW